MNVKHYSKPFPYIIINDLFDGDELDLIWQELEFICHQGKMSSPEETGSATENNVYLKKNIGVWLDNVYADRKYSNILTLNRKIFTHRQFIWANHPHWFFKQDCLNTDTTLISYYENSDYYEKHADQAYFSAITWFFKEPKRFKNGDLIFDDCDIKIEVANNKTIIFPSMIKHSVEKIEMSPQYLEKNMGRFSMVQFARF